MGGGPCHKFLNNKEPYEVELAKGNFGELEYEHFMSWGWTVITGCCDMSRWVFNCVEMPSMFENKSVIFEEGDIAC